MAFELLRPGGRGAQTELDGIPQDHQHIMRPAVVDERDRAGVGRDAVYLRGSDAGAPVVRIEDRDPVKRAAVLPLERVLAATARECTDRC